MMAIKQPDFGKIVSKQIIVFIDGTGNNGWIDGPERTNVFKLYQRVKQSTPLARYIRGIGSDPEPMDDMKAALWVRIRNKCNQGLGIGATDRLKRAYRFIARHYETGDQIFLFGFSRGAFLAQILAGFLQRVGLLFRYAPPDAVEEAFWLYWADSDGRLFKDFLREVMPATTGVDGIRTHFLGQWDAVESMDVAGISAASETLLREIAARERTKPLPHWINHARHAVALHEVRAPFEPLLWSGVSLNTQTLEQVWFAGAHADVGGGYAPGDGAGTRYSDISLCWMWQEAKSAGLPLCDPPPRHVPLQPQDIPHTPSLFLFGGRPASVRQALAELAAAPRNWEYLHVSALERMWQPIEEAYEQADNMMRVAWHDADEASMRFHYRLRFGAGQCPVLTPAAIQRAVRALEAFLEGKRVLSHEELVQYTSVALAFKAPLLEQYKHHSSFSAAPTNRIVAAADALRGLFVEPNVDILREDWDCQRCALHRIALHLKSSGKTPAPPKDDHKL